MTLVDGSEIFYYIDQAYAGCWYRIFNYQLPTYTSFMRPNALECRGHTFQISPKDGDAEMLRLASLPMEKFFNLYENPATMKLDLSTVVAVEEKADGSMISTYLHVHDSGEAELRLKSRKSLFGDQAIAAQQWLLLNMNLREELRSLATRDYTINMEWVAPDNRIVLDYQRPALRVLNIRNNRDGSYVSIDTLPESYQAIRAHRISTLNIDDLDVSVAAFIAGIPDMTDREGFVVQLDSGQRVKIKTSWYLALHHTKDNVNSPRRLFEAVLEDATDDLKSLFHDDQAALQTILDMESFVQQQYRQMVNTVEQFYERNKTLSRKDYAVLAQEALKDTFYFVLAMDKYLGKAFSYKDFLKSRWKLLGLKDTEPARDQ